MQRLGLLALLLATSACQQSEVRSVVFYSFALLEESAPDEHYQQFVDLNGGVVDFGCFVVQRRQLNCFDNDGIGLPNLHLGVVECTCPCVEEEPDPCDDKRPPVRKGIVRGLVNTTQGPLQLGGVELPTRIDLADATNLFITIESTTDPAPGPSGNVLMGGKLHSDGTVVRGRLESPGTNPVQGTVTILPVQDEVSL